MSGESCKFPSALSDRCCFPLVFDAIWGFVPIVQPICSSGCDTYCTSVSQKNGDCLARGLSTGYIQPGWFKSSPSSLPSDSHSLSCAEE